MNLKGGFFTDSLNGVPAILQKIVKCEVKRCVYPTTKNLMYYLSEHGDLFSTQLIQGKVLVRGPKKPGTKSKNGTTLRLSNGRHGAGSESWIRAELLVYCTFNLGRWEPDLRIDFKNGKASDIKPDNLQEHVEEIPPEWTENLKQYCGIYDDWFNEIVIRVMWWCGLSKEDAKDVTSQTFLWLCTDGYKDAMNFRLWIYWAKLRGYDFKRHHSDYYNTEDYDLILDLRGTEPPTYEVDMIHIQKGDRRQRFLKLWAQGHTPTEIAEMEGSTVSNVGASVTRSVRFLKKYFAHDKEMFRRRQTTDVQ